MEAFNFLLFINCSTEPTICMCIKRNVIYNHFYSIYLL